MVWRSLFRGWVQEQMADTVRRHVGEATEKASEEARATMDDLPPCDVGFVFALGIEAGGLEDLLSDISYLRGEKIAVRFGNLEGRRVVIVISGPGAKAARHATEALLRGHRPRWVVSSGFAGALKPQPRFKDIVMADHLVNQQGQRVQLDLQVDRESAENMRGVHLGTLLSADRLIRQPQEKRELGERFDALAVDLETFATAQVCAAYQVPLLSVRVISDEVDTQLPPEVDYLMDLHKWSEKLGGAVGALWRRPSSIKDFWALKERGLIASDHLAQFLKSMAASLPRPEIEDTSDQPDQSGE